MQINKKYAVILSITTNSFYDPDCGANLFKSTPMYQFNHEPTEAIKLAVKNGRLKDMLGNIMGASEAGIDVNKLKAEIRSELEIEFTEKMNYEVSVINAEHENAIKQLTAEYESKIEQLKVEVKPSKGKKEEEK